MNSEQKKSRPSWYLILIFAIFFGLYPLSYIFLDDTAGIVEFRSVDVSGTKLWIAIFIIHITFAAIAMISGLFHFSNIIRTRYEYLHKNANRTYLISVIICGISGFCIALFATGGILSTLGLSNLAVMWIGTTVMAHSNLKKRNFIQHKLWMVRSYALCFAAIQIRLWLLFFGGILQQKIESSIPIIAWLCWIPNLFIAEIIIHHQLKKLESLPNG